MFYWKRTKSVPLSLWGLDGYIITVFSQIEAPVLVNEKSHFLRF